jgi:hypothetical protein
MQASHLQAYNPHQRRNLIHSVLDSAPAVLILEFPVFHERTQHHFIRERLFARTFIKRVNVYKQCADQW